MFWQSKPSCRRSREPHKARFCAQIIRSASARYTIFRRSKAAIRGGKTYEEAVEHAEEALAVYLETLDELGKSIPEQRRQKQPVSLDSADAHHRLIFSLDFEERVQVPKPWERSVWVSNCRRKKEKQ
jgi:hypothetical protein